MTTQTTFTRTVQTSLSFDDAVEHAITELSNRGFGVLCDIDVKETLKKKLDVDRTPYRILGACNPPLAHKALKTEPELGALLPCNMIVRIDDEGLTHVSAIDAERMLSIVGRDDLTPVAAEVNEKLSAVLETFPTA